MNLLDGLQSDLVTEETEVEDGCVREEVEGGYGSAKTNGRGDEKVLTIQQPRSGSQNRRESNP